MRTVLDKENKISQQVSCSQNWAPLAKGSRVGEYRIVEEISHNGQSITYQAQDCVIGDTVRIQEFFPFRMARRCEDGCTVEPLPNCQTQFKYFRASFMDLYQTLAGEKENPLNALPPREHVLYYIERGMEKKEALKRAAKDRGVSKSDRKSVV